MRPQDIKSSRKLLTPLTERRLRVHQDKSSAKQALSGDDCFAKRFSPNGPSRGKGKRRRAREHAAG
eukprot:4962595-Prymnesium_polylepis.1